MAAHGPFSDSVTLLMCIDFAKECEKSESDAVKFHSVLRTNVERERKNCTDGLTTELTAGRVCGLQELACHVTSNYCTCS